MTTPSENFLIKNPFYIACEGDSDAAFISRLLQHNQINGFSVKPSEGKGDGFRRHLIGLYGASTREKLRCLVVVADSDNNPQSNFEDVRCALIEAGFSAPAAPEEILTTHTPATAIYMLPSATSQGALETLLFDALIEKDAELKRCLDAFCVCLGTVQSWDLVKKSKMLLNASIAARCHDDPGSSLRYVWSKQDNPIPIESQKYQGIVNFLRQVASTTF